MSTGQGTDQGGATAPLWRALEENRARSASRRILSLFDDDPARFEGYSAESDGMLLDFSKTNIDRAALDLLVDLACAAGVEARREAMFRGEKINATEGRAALHTALRTPGDGPLIVDGTDIRSGVRETLARMERFAEGVRSGRIAAAGGAPFSDVVNIGIGGSDLGPEMATRALAPWHDGPRCHFVSNVDGAAISDTLAGLDPARTLVIISSKSFTTVETMTNAETALRWLRAAVGEAARFHLAAVSSAPERTAAFGVPGDRVFGYADWVGGRYSVWGPVGLPVMLAVGAENFRRFLEGGAAMDRHFRAAPLRRNLPVLLGLVGIWHRNICGHASRAVVPYDQRLARLPAYLQQLDMESNGKGVRLDGAPVPRDSGPVVWGAPGTDGQHAFFQLLHQGTDVVPVEFLIAARGHEADLAHHHDLLKAACLAQSEALMRGRSFDEALEIVRAAGLDGEEARRQAAHRVFSGNRPSVTIAYERLTPFVLGQIVALYEHRVFTEATIWGINPFDQWGVELGKDLAGALLPAVRGDEPAAGRDGSTLRLLARLRHVPGDDDG